MFVRKNCFVRKTFSYQVEAYVPWLHKVKQVPRNTTNQAPTLVSVEPIALLAEGDTKKMCCARTASAGAKQRVRPEVAQEKGLT